MLHTQKAVIAACLCLATTLAGCNRNFRIAPDELNKLDGFRLGQSRALIDLNGRRIPFTEASYLTLAMVGRTKLAHRFYAIDIREGVFTGRTHEGEVVDVRLDDVEAAAVSVFSRGRAIGYTLAGIGAGLIVAAVVLFVLLVVLIVQSGAAEGN